MPKNNFRIIPVFLLIAVFSLCCDSPESRDLKEYRETRPLFGATVTIHCFYPKNADMAGIARRCWQRLEEIQVSMNARSAVGDLARVNKSGFSGVRVKDDVYNLLKRAKEFSRLTHGAFDVTVFPLVELWQDAVQHGRLPDDNSVRAAKDKVGYTYIRLKKNNTVFLEKKGMKIDLGAIAKGYAVDEVAGILARNKIRHFLIDAGGDIYCRGKQGGKTAWTVGVQDPTNKTGIVDVIKVENAAVTTSGNYERFYTVQGKQFSHIINPLTGYPQAAVISATVIAPSAEEADAYATALCVMGGERGIALMNSLADVEAMIIENLNGRLEKYATKGYTAK